MPLIKCAECQREVSDNQRKCVEDFQRVGSERVPDQAAKAAK